MLCVSVSLWLILSVSHRSCLVTVAMAIKDALLAEYDHEMGTTRKLLERVPDDKLAWRPHERSMSMGGLATHVSRIPSWGDIDPRTSRHSIWRIRRPARRRADVARRACWTSFDEIRARTRARMDKTDAEYNCAVDAQTRRTGDILAAAGRRRFAASCCTTHPPPRAVERLLRLNDVPVPAIYGPSADEGS